MIKIIAVGKIKEKFLKEGIENYKKRILKYTKIEIIELEDSNKQTEFDLIMRHIKVKDNVILLDLEGKEVTSLELADLIDKSFIKKPNLCFVIGGSEGFDKRIKELNFESISFSKLTFPHQLFRLLLLEQVYRSYKIINNETYHK